jgi:hypothetical protein
MKECWRKEIDEFEQEHRRDVTKGDFTHLFGRAYIKAFDEDTIKAAFCVTGVHPFSCEAITEDQLKPSIPHSVKGSFPLPQPSPVQAVMAVFHHQPLTSFDVSPSTHSVAPSSPSESHRRARDPNIDPALYTPLKRMRMMYSTLGGMTTGLYLVSNTKFTSATPVPSIVLEKLPDLPQPDWSVLETEHEGWKTRQQLERENKGLRSSLGHAKTHLRARDLMLEGTHAQLVVQDIHLHKTQRALHNKEHRSTGGRMIRLCYSMDRHRSCHLMSFVPSCKE